MFYFIVLSFILKPLDRVVVVVAETLADTYGLSLCFSAFHLARVSLARITEGG